MRGIPAFPAEQIEALPKAVGELYTRWRYNIFDGHDTQLITVRFEPTVTTAEHTRQEVATQQGLAVEITDDFGNVHTNCQLLRAIATYEPIVADIDGNTYRLVAIYIVRVGRPYGV